MLRGDELPGPERLAVLAAGFERDSGVPCHVAVTGEERDLGPDGRLTLYRSRRNPSRTSAGTHRAERVEIRLAYEPDGTRVARDLGRRGQHPAPADGPATG